MAFDILPFRPPVRASGRAAIRLLAALLVMAIGWGGMLQAANQSIQGAKKEEPGGFDGDAPTAILIEATSGSVLFEKAANDLIPPASLSKLMTAEVVFNELKQGRRKPSDEFAVPLCRVHHRAVHRARDERAWWQTTGIDPIKVARKLWKDTRIDEGRIEPDRTLSAAAPDRTLEPSGDAAKTQATA